ncbi:MAG: serpin family protein [Lachnospiraceae bacterium]|nr:serpin family protein [Lachnospiraceae bacterium]
MNKNPLKKIFLLSAALCLSLFLFGCGAATTLKEISPEREKITEEPEASEKKESEKEASEKEDDSADKKKETEVEKTTVRAATLAEAVNTFNWNYYNTQDTDSNLFYSPISLESALAMALKGAKNDTYEELADVLCIGDMNTFMDSYSSLSSGYGDEKIKLTVANSLWIDKTFDKEYGVDPDFVSELEKKMDAEVILEDFKNNSEKAASDITDWVKKKTENLIPDYQSVASADTALDIINAIYFFGEWRNKFSADNTSSQDFRRPGGTVTVDMMNMNDEYFRYFKDGGFKGIELPYYDDKAVMDIILTDDDNDLSAPEAFKSLSAKEREDFISGISSAEEVKISMLMLPKFTMDITAEGLKESLINLGAASAFDKNKADFSGICEKLFISDISHRAKIEVDEEGSRAAAVTEVVMELASAIAEPEEIIDFVCDRPFVFVIRDRESGTILFTGIVNEP